MPETPLLNTQITLLPYCSAVLKAISNTISVSYSVNVKIYYVVMLVLKQNLHIANILEQRINEYQMNKVRLGVQL